MLQFKTSIVGLSSGVLFGLGLAVSGMTDTQKVKGFLDVFGNWDITLAFVMASALLITIPSFYFIQKRKAPLCNLEFSVPKNNKTDNKLIFGAALFGIGWGMVGWCPGPAIASLVYLDLTVVYFLLAMFVGMAIANKV
ncbi:DUF6691 family protein [Catenovulum sediminis]|uniref:DUF6691 family protein n=1 Tax=Catenovulum sediminis TaxID=1740262 RepID=A0ABV1RG13_9ALTE|nr:DUF6691 family protein [Catenovulum sediminis]